MHRHEIITSLSKDYPDDVVNSLVGSYISALGEYRKENWKFCAIEAGQFVESARRMIHYKLTGESVPLDKEMSEKFTNKQLLFWENKESIYPEEYRIIIPRNIYAMYCIRNKRGAAHLTMIDPNKMDASLLINNSKWVLSEFFRLSSKKPFDETIDIVESIMNRDSSLIWNIGDTARVLDPKMSCNNQILCLLYAKDNQSRDELLKATEYKNPSRFDQILGGLHDKRLIEYKNQKCTLSPLGINEAEKLLK